jgi:cytochrome b561
MYWRQLMLSPKDLMYPFIMANLHKPFGAIILVLGFIMLLWRFFNLKPEFLGMPTWEKIAANVSHTILYICLLLVPLSGAIMSMSAGYPISMFGLFDLPMLVSKNIETAKIFQQIHTLLGIILLVTIIIHFLAAMKHHFIDKDNVLKRML